ncbi:hypothetical protein RUM43_014504 [Polyplax serrata]|uniref:Uncharacterized protein n=1 Tax=Polyplax serrata TaxID=468196 RepID=A0AAN8P0Y5_POLSC
MLAPYSSTLQLVDDDDYDDDDDDDDDDGVGGGFGSKGHLGPSQQGQGYHHHEPPQGLPEHNSTAAAFGDLRPDGPSETAIGAVGGAEDGVQKACLSVNNVSTGLAASYQR